ncbi:TonB family protein [Hymenobacter sp. M29]|uniref:TonB family protein n=1 Tax=Hymenobacter mellowenesis TaxID=3063995 RepID=A0ABT9AIA4_9BACT|nr:TonB family protein [Hymenobacter sp. M29]MDO7848840.1 TonB family protein [Hymenobacter sp. M29]
MSPADSPFAQLPAPGPHPATAELRAYAAGQLAPADEHRIEAHTLDCERCAELVEGFAMSDGPTTDRAVAELRTRLQARLGQAEPEPAAGWAWPRIAAAAALLAVVGTGIWGWEQYETAAPATTARVETASEPAVPATIASKPAAPVASSATGPSSVASASQATKTADQAAYAAVSSAAVSRADARRATARARFVPPTAAQVAALEQAEDAKAANAVAMAAPPPAAPAASAAQATQAAAVSDDKSREPELARADFAPAAKSESAPPSRPATDSMLSLSEVTVAAPAAKKMKALMPAAAPAMVPNTPMPAGFAIKPAPVGGTPSFRDYLRREASQFEPEKEARISGLVRVQFTVGADGQLSNLKVTRGMRADYDEEALRLVCDGPKWQPGIAGGRRAPLVMEFTVPF